MSGLPRGQHTDGQRVIHLSVDTRTIGTLVRLRWRHQLHGEPGGEPNAELQVPDVVGVQAVLGVKIELCRVFAQRQICIHSLSSDLTSPSSICP